MLADITTRVTIRASTKTDQSFLQSQLSELTNDENVFRAMFNPETYTEEVELLFDTEQAEGETASNQKFKGIKPREFSMDFLIDGTGASGELVSVSKAVEKFKKVTGHSGEVHEPKFLTVSWGKFNVACRLRKFAVKYTLFRPDGSAARCVISADFQEYKTKEQQDKENNNNSPDLTHYRTVNDQDTLPLFANEIYGESSYYLELARINGLDNFRALPNGKRLEFPPIDKAV